MTNIIHQFRVRSGAIASAMLFVLMATWLSVLCPQCLANAADAPPPASHCHSDEVPTGSGPVGDHSCCDTAHGGPCPGVACAEISALTQAELKVIAPAGVQFDVLATETHDAFPQAPPPSAQYSLSPPIPHTDCPLYLLHCSFLN